MGQETREVYAVELALGSDIVGGLGGVPPDEDEGWRRLWFRTLDTILEGWPEEPYGDID